VDVVELDELVVLVGVDTESNSCFKIKLLGAALPFALFAALFAPCTLEYSYVSIWNRKWMPFSPPCLCGANAVLVQLQRKKMLAPVLPFHITSNTFV
jgi:hypothetical protein